MKMLLIGAGTATSTRDVENGYAAALRDLGVDLKLYALEARITVARDWLAHQWRRRGRHVEEKIGWPDVIYRASVEALEMALRYEVDWVLAISGMFLHPDAVILMRRAGLKVATIFTESPYEDLAQLRLAQLVDYCWTTERTSARTLRAGYLPHAYDPRQHYPGPVDMDVPAHDVVFVGTGFIERCRWLADIDWSGIDLGLYGEWALLGSRNPLRHFVRGGLVDNAEAIKLYRRASIGLNLFRSSARYGHRVPHHTRAESANPRAFELAACGVFQLAQFRPEVRELFDSAVPIASEGSIRYALRDDDWRRECIERAQHLVTGHTYAARAVQVLADLEALEPVHSKGA